MKKYLPEGSLINSPENTDALRTENSLADAAANGKILEGRVKLCTRSHDLIVDLPCMKGIIPREEGAIGITEGNVRDIALITKVGKAVCFCVRSITRGSDGTPTALLSRRAAQEECMKNYISALTDGDIIPARVTHLEQFGAFVDIGCGIPSLIPIDAVSVSRISHPSDRFSPGQFIKAVVKGRSADKILLSHKELLGTWEENAAMFSSGETVPGIVRSVEEYGIFIELAPNLAGLAEPGRDIHAGQQAAVYIKAIIPEKMKIKLIIVDTTTDKIPPAPLKYFYKGNRITNWQYSSRRQTDIN